MRQDNTTKMRTVKGNHVNGERFSGSEQQKLYTYIHPFIQSLQRMHICESKW